MGVLTDLRRKWFVSFLSAATAVFFAGALIASAMNYIGVMDAIERVELKDAVESAVLFPNGSIAISLTIALENPSKFPLVTSTVSWVVKVFNVTETGVEYIPVLNHFGVPPGFQEVGARETVELRLEAWVSDPEILSSLSGFANRSGDDGLSLEDIPYVHDMRIVAWVDDFDHDYSYSGEAYLNEMVRLERRYYTGGDL